MASKNVERCSTLLVISEMKNQDHNEIPLYSYQNGYNYFRKQKLTTVEEDLEKLESSYNVEWFSH